MASDIRRSTLLAEMFKPGYFCFLHQSLFIKQYPEAATGSILYKKVFLKISQNSKETPVPKPRCLIKLKAKKPATFFKKRLWHRCFQVHFAKFLTSVFFTEHLREPASVIQLYGGRDGP